MENKTETKNTVPEQGTQKPFPECSEAGVSTKKPKGLAKIILILLLILLLALGGYRLVKALMPEDEAADAPVNVKVTTAKLDTITAESLLSGRIEAADEANVVPMAAGEVTAVYVELGDYVTEGQTLFTIDDSQIRSSRDSAQIGYSQALENQASAKTSLDRMSYLYKEGAISLQTYEQAQTAYTQATLSVEQAAVSIDSLNTTLAYYTVSAPISGYVTAVNVSRGNMASQAGTAISISDTRTLELSSSVPEYLISKIHEGDTVNVDIKTASDKPFKGTVKYLAPAPASGSLTYAVTISIDNPGDKVYAGMFAEVSLVTEKKENVICLPSAAVFVKGGKTLVAILDKNDKAELREVTSGLDNGEKVEITSGVKEGETVVISGQNYVTDGNKVRVVK